MPKLTVSQELIDYLDNTRDHLAGELGFTPTRSQTLSRLLNHVQDTPPSELPSSQRMVESIPSQRLTTVESESNNLEETPKKPATPVKGEQLFNIVLDGLLE